MIPHNDDLPGMEGTGDLERMNSSSRRLALAAATSPSPSPMLDFAVTISFVAFEKENAAQTDPAVPLN